VALPNYGRSKRGMPVLDHKAAATNPWSTAPPTDSLPGSEPPAAAQHVTLAERARTTAVTSRSAVLCFVGPDNRGPISFAVACTIDGQGRPLVSVRRSFTALVDVRPEAIVSVTFAATPLASSSADSSSGLTILGMLEVIGREGSAEAMAEFGRSQPTELGALKRSVARLFRVRPTSAFMTDSSEGVLDVDLDDYASAVDDPLAIVAPGLMVNLSGDQDGSLVLLARAFGGVASAVSARLVGLDQYGMDLLVEAADSTQSVRLPFGKAVGSAEEVRRELSMMTRGARFKLGVG
jgi:hypothetical protein